MLKTKPKKNNIFSSTKLLTRVTVADKLVLVNPFWWNSHLFIVNLLFIRSFKLICTARVNLELSDVTKWYYSTVPYGRGIWEKESIIGVQWFSGSRKNPNTRVHSSVENSASLVPLKRLTLRLGFFCPHWTPMMDSICPTSLPMWKKRNQYEISHTGPVANVR